MQQLVTCSRSRVRARSGAEGPGCWAGAAGGYPCPHQEPLQLSAWPGAAGAAPAQGKRAAWSAPRFMGALGRAELCTPQPGAGHLLFMATSAAIPGSCPVGFTSALARKKTSIGPSTFPSPVEQREPAHGSSQLPSACIFKTLFSSLGLLNYLWVAQLTEQQSGPEHILAGQRAAACRTRRAELSLCLLGCPGAPGMQSCPP